jgi:hypothetical protein
MEMVMESSYGTSRAHARMINCWFYKEKRMIASFSSDSIAQFAFGGKPLTWTKKLVCALVGLMLNC